MPDLQSLKLVCFMVAKTWKQKYADSRLFEQYDHVLLFIVEDDDV